MVSLVLSLSTLPGICKGGVGALWLLWSLGYYSDISWSWAWAGIILFPVTIDFLSNFHFLWYIPLVSEQRCQTKAGLSPLEIFLDSLQLCVYIKGQPDSVIKWPDSGCLAGWTRGIRLSKLLELRLESQVVLLLALYLNLWSLIHTSVEFYSLKLTEVFERQEMFYWCYHLK